MDCHYLEVMIFLSQPTNPALLRHFPPHRGDVHEETLEGPLRDQPHGRVDAERDHPVLRLCSREAEGIQKAYCLVSKYLNFKIDTKLCAHLDFAIQSFFRSIVSTHSSASSR